MDAVRVAKTKLRSPVLIPSEPSSATFAPTWTLPSSYEPLRLFHGELARPPLRGLPIHHGTASRAQVAFVPHHAGGDAGNVGNLRTAQAESVAAAHLLRFHGEGEARIRREG